MKIVDMLFNDSVSRKLLILDTGVAITEAMNIEILKVIDLNEFDISNDQFQAKVKFVYIEKVHDKSIYCRFVSKQQIKEHYKFGLFLID
jgi:hypothetical protein